MRLVVASLPENLSKELGVDKVPALMVARSAGGVERTMQMMSVKGRQEFAKDKEVGKLVNKKKQVFALVADNQNSQAAANLLLLALQNCPSDANAVVLLNGDVSLPSEAAELEKKCNTKIYPPIK